MAAPAFRPRRELDLRGFARAYVGELGRIRWRRLASGKQVPFIDLHPHGRIYSSRDALGVVPLRTRGDAKRLLERIRARVEDGVPVEVVVDALRPEGSSHVDKRAPAWVEAKARQADAGEIEHASVRQIRHQVRRYWGPWEGKPVGAITRGDLDDWVTWLLEGGLHPRTVRGILATFRSFLHWLEDREEIERTPRFPRVRVPDHVPQLLTRAQQEAVLDQIPEAKRGIFLFAAELAVRPSEARAVFLADFDLGGDVPWVTICRAYKGPNTTDPIRGTKTRLSRRLPVTDRVAEWLRAHADPSQPLVPVFRSVRRKPWTRSGLNQAWKRACRQAEVPVVPFREGTRHSTSTWMREEGWALELIQHILGHTSLAHTQVYARRSDAALVKALRRAR